MKGGPSVAVSLIAVEDAGLALVPNRKRHTQQQRCYHDSRFVAGSAGLLFLFKHAEKRPLGNACCSRHARPVKRKQRSERGSQSQDHQPGQRQ